MDDKEAGRHPSRFKLFHDLTGTKVEHNRVENEKMAVLIQQVVGNRYNNFFTGGLSGDDICISNQALGNTINSELADILCVQPETLDPSKTDDGKQWPFFVDTIIE